jgi:8-oxo-dGTP pyrophosphatase MutT (NUDIX family)
MNSSADSHATTFTETDFRSRARSHLLREPTEDIFDPNSGKVIGRSDWDLNPEFLADRAVMEPPQPAAVLVPIVVRSSLTLLLTERTASLKKHAGQIAFPGGRVDAEDATPIATALREAEEEIGLDPGLVEPLGFLDSYRTGTGFLVRPVVAFVKPSFSLRLAEGEVADAFEVPLAFLMDPANHMKDSREWRGRMRAYYAMTYGERYIWGATAGMLKNMYERLYAR